MVLKTPHIDEIAKSGIRFTNFYCNNPICMPNRSTIFTGQYPSSHGVTTNGRNLPQGTRTFLDVMLESGEYHTASFGKIHLNYFGANSGKYESPSVSQEFAHPKKYDDLTNYSPYFGLDEVKLISGHGTLCGHPDYMEWVKKKIEKDDSLRKPMRIRLSDNLGAMQAKLNLSINTTQSFVNIQVIKHNVPEEIYSTTFVKENTIEFLERFAVGQYDKPNFFAFCSFPDPHHPYSPPGKYFDMYKPEDVTLPPTFNDNHENDSEFNKTHYNEILKSEGTEKKIFPIPKDLTEMDAKRVLAASYGVEKMMDDAIGEITESLEKLGLAENTVIIYTTDHGDLGGEHHFFFKGPFLYQGLIKIPLIIKVPGGIQNKVCNSLTSSIDLPETILELAGFSIPDSMQGKSMEPLLRDPHKEINEDVMLEMNDDHNNQKIRTIISDEWRLSVFREHGELFNLMKDPNEMNNLWNDDDHLRVKTELLLKLTRREILSEKDPVVRDCGY